MDEDQLIAFYNAFIDCFVEDEDFEGALRLKWVKTTIWQGSTT